MNEKSSREEPGSTPRLLQMMLAKTPGGADRFFEKTCMAFAEAGVPQTIVIEPNSEREELFRSVPGMRVEAIRFGGLREPWGGLRLRRVIADFRPDVVLSWMSRASRRMPAGNFVRVARLGDYYPLQHYRRCDHLVANTPDIKDYIQRGGWPESQVELIGNFCDPPSLEGAREDVRAEVRRENAIPDQAPLLVALGRLHPKKGHDVLFRAMTSLPDCHLLLAGEGPLREELETLARELGVGDRVRFLGWRRDTDRLLAAADYCVVSSRFEPLGNVVLEAWASRVPLVAARATGPELLVEDGKTGLLFPVDDHDALASSLRRLMDAPDLREALVSQGYERFVRDFSRDAFVRQYLDFFRKIREKRRAE